MERRIVRTSDGSRTIQIPQWQEQYHSMHGALQESRHVFIRHGLSLYADRKLRVLEMGFGTGLNALISLLEAPKLGLVLEYTALEAYPVTQQEWQALDYGGLFEDDAARDHFQKLHQADWEKPSAVTPWFTLCKVQADLLGFSEEDAYDLVYFDAFGARVQPELWTEAVFGSMFRALGGGGRLVTYAAKGSVRRAMQACGFTVERLPGPPGKREMLRAVKPV
ncbi:tRNA (5-methylaminomethyl-2-thiouridine)(34)-methyltransferase MnmD [Robiginitalea sp. SC105]|uniref:tRNA (5-methylaminomethyl-2-thiouridine)(34)-methyltransferase MnmD n=1 Tax=Robiginitalea sp. SC105 TaxID=2762332 RepID=UPI00163A949F|nr:tRNA (5-methylaminomethyl-2-thiouridine)(34)-methyltransferase MnmD [Robiginitalea sp. SC105]MBC2839898.1 tRNA (5-methylaminomethyl-2-thiouridine)(34)-methyltransferase MnmD [Robiginitalea sp. SC105]